VELARTQLQNRIQHWYRKNGNNRTHPQPQLHHRATTDQQPMDPKPATPAPLTTTKYRIPGERSPIIIESRTPTPTSPAYDHNSPTNNDNDNDATAPTSKPYSLGGYTATNTHLADPATSSGKPRPTLSSILSNLRINAPPHLKPRNQPKDQTSRHFKPIARARIAHSKSTNPKSPSNPET
jgi:hypothetical protein